MTDIYILDDEKDIRTLLTGFLEDEGYQVQSAACSDSFLELLNGRLPDVALLDIWLKNSRLDGMEILIKLRETHPDIPVIMISGHGTIETAVHALKLGACDFLEKPLKIDCLTAALRRALEISSLRRENDLLKAAQAMQTPSAFQGASQFIRELRAGLVKCAASNSRVFITGKPGSGKEVAARAIHAASPRAAGPFVVCSVAGLSPEDAEKKFFGYFEKSHPDAPPRSGLLEKAHGGVLYLDEVSDYPLPLQQKITRFLTENGFARYGQTEKTVKCDVRLIAATAHIPEELIKHGTLSADLYQRLSISKINVPSLASRREDIEALAPHFFDLYAKKYSVTLPEISEEVMICLQTYSWPGNVRRLMNVIEQVILNHRANPDARIEVTALPKEIRESSPPVLYPGGTERLIKLRLREAREVFEREYLVAQLIRFRGNVSKTAAFIGMERSALHRKLKSLNVVEAHDLDAETPA